MKFGAILLVLLAGGANGARLRATQLTSMTAVRQNKTVPYVLDRCTEVQDVFGKADYIGKDPMSLQVCYTFCASRNAFYFGVRGGQKCWCGSQYQARVGSVTICDVPCQGDKKSMCGGNDATSVYIMGKGPCDEKPKSPVGDSDDKNLGEAQDALAKVVKEAKKVVDKKNEKHELKGAQRIDEAKHLVAQAKEDIKSGDDAAAKQKLEQASTKVKSATDKFDDMKAFGKTTKREKQAEADLKVVKKALEDVKANPSNEGVKKADKLLKQAAAKPPPKRASVCLNLNAPGKSFEFKGLNGRFLRHQSFRLKVSEKADDDLFKNDATFEIMPPLLTSANCGISLRSKNFPENYMRHRNFELHLDKNADNDLFKNDATFFAVAPKDPSLTGAYLLRSVNFPDRYVHIRANGEAYLDQLAAGTEKEFVFGIVDPLMTPLGSMVWKEAKTGDWGEVDCGPGFQLIGGGCNARKGPYKMQRNSPKGTADAKYNKWKCGGHGGPKQIWAVCLKDSIKRQVITTNGGDWTSVKCPSGQHVIGGGCDAHNSPHVMQYSGPEGAGGWKCGGHGGPKKVFAICTADVKTTLKEVQGGDWTTVKCDKGKKVVSGGCNAKDRPYIFQYNGPEGKDGWKCGGHGGNKQVWAICEA